MREDASKVEEVLRSAGFARPAQLSEEVPSVKTQELKESIQQLNNEIKEQEDKIKSCAEERERLRYISDYFRMRAEKYEVLGTLPQSQRTFVISGYTAKKFVPALEKAIGANYDCVMDVEEVGEEEEVPTILQNNSFSRSWEGIVESYGLPKRGEFDPTTIMSFFYVFFFGMMLSDAAYGAILAIACFVLLKKFPRMECTSLSNCLCSVEFPLSFGESCLADTLEILWMWYRQNFSEQRSHRRHYGLFL